MNELLKEKAEQEKANFCTNCCPHPDSLCIRDFCEEYKKKFRLGKYSPRRKKKEQIKR